jgi:hypothetical protein
VWEHSPLWARPAIMFAPAAGPRIPGKAQALPHKTLLVPPQANVRQVATRTVPLTGARTNPPTVLPTVLLSVIPAACRGGSPPDDPTASPLAAARKCCLTTGRAGRRPAGAPVSTPRAEAACA